MAEPRGRRPWRTLRFRVTVAAFLAVAALLVVGAVVVVATQRGDLAGERDDRLEDQAEGAAERLNEGAVASAVAADLASGGFRVQVRSADGTVLADGGGPGGSATAWAVPTPRLDDDGGDDDDRGTDDDDGADGAGDASLATATIDGERFRVASAVAEVDGDVLVVSVAEAVDDVAAGTTALVGVLRVLVPVGALAVAALAWVLVGRTLRPVAAIRREADAIGAGDLHRRVPEPGTDDEVDRLARTVNAMLGRLETGAEREARFTSDASHELRTPLTRMRVALEVEAAHPDAADPAATRAALVGEVVAMQALVEDLLQLSRTGAGGGADVARRRAEVDLDDVVLAEATALRSAGARPRIDLSGVRAVRVRGDGAELARVVRNLLENAARHAASTVTVHLVEAAGEAVLTVADDGPGIPPAERERVFDRFVRLDEARSAGAGGTGLGLAIVRSIVEAHGGRVAVEDPVAPATGATVRVRLPLAPG